MTDNDAVLKLVSTGYSLLAEDLYELVESRGDLPTVEKILQLMQGKDEFEQAGNAINELFIDLAKEAFLNTFHPEHRSEIEPLLTVSKELYDNSKNDFCSFQFLGQVLDKFDKGSIDAFCNSLKRYQNDFIFKDIEGKHTIAFKAPYELIQQLVRIRDLHPYLYQSVNTDNDTDKSKSYILNIGEIRTLSTMKQFEVDYYSGIHKFIQQHTGWSFITIFDQYKVDYFVINILPNN